MLATLRRRFTLALMSLLFLTMFSPLNILPGTALAQTKPVQCPQGTLCSLKIASPTSTAHPLTTTNLTVNANQDLPGLDTGIDLTSGSNITITAQGWASYGIEGTGYCDGTPLTNPDGQRMLNGTPCDPKYDSAAVLPTSPIGELIAQIGSSGWFAVGSNDGFTVATNGRLFLLYNDDSGFYGDNSASYQVTVTTSTSSSVTVQKVWTADSNNTVKTSFAPGNAIHYWVQVTNPNSATVTATFTYLTTGPQQIFSWSGPVSVPPGTIPYDYPTTVPTTAPAGTYTLTIKVTYNGVSSQGQSQFTVTPTSPVTQWQSPQNGFYIQGDHVTLSVSVTSGASQITGVRFTASWDSNTNVSICNGGLTGGKWVCQWAMKYNKSFVRNGPITFGYTVITATQPIVNPNGTRAGTIVYELTDDNPIYAGYSTASQNDTVTYTMVVAKWTVPKATCGFAETSKSAIWAGIAGKTQLAQIATESNCTLGKPKYLAQWEVIPLITPAQTINKTVSPGDKMVATVTYVSKNNTFKLTLVDTGKWTVPITTPALASSSERTHGECVVEAPSAGNNAFIYPLTNFGTVSLDCQVAGRPVANGPENIKFVMVSNVPKALTNLLATNGEVFTVVWKHA